MCPSLSGIVALYACYSGVFINNAPFDRLTGSSSDDKLYGHPTYKAPSDLPYSPDSGLASPYLAHYLLGIVNVFQSPAFPVSVDSKNRSLCLVLSLGTWHLIYYLHTDTRYHGINQLKRVPGIW